MLSAHIYLLCFIGHEKALKAFWEYFRRTYLPISSTWNVHGLTALSGDYASADLINRTNNPSESFNKQLNAEFSSTNALSSGCKPSIDNFVVTLKSVARKSLQKYMLVFNGQEHVAMRTLTLHKVPDDYEHWTPLSSFVQQLQGTLIV